MIDLDALDIVPYPHPALRWMAKPIPETVSLDLIRNVIERMFGLMHDYHGVGLAATQIGIPWRIFITCVNDKELVFINPIVHLGKNKRDSNLRTTWDYEACLSLPGLHAQEKIPRSRDVYVEALGVDGEPFTISGPGMLARVIQHENDHLNGVLFIDHIKTRDVKEHVNGWCNYLETQYQYLTPPKSGKPKYDVNEVEKEKLVRLEHR
jgi:peptide deformylase